MYYPFANGTDVTNLFKHAENSFYINSTTAPSFLNRLEGKFTPDPNGIESLVYLPNLPLSKDKSCVDYIYFSSNDPTTGHIQGMPSWFKLDDDHIVSYNLTGLAI